MNLKKNIKTLYVRVNPVEECAIRMFFYFVCLSFSLFWFLWICPFLSISTTNLCSKKYMSFLILSFSKILCSIFSAENAFNSGITTDYSFFSIKLIWLNPKSDLNLTVSRFDNVLGIIIEIAIASLAYIDSLLPLINLD